VGFVGSATLARVEQEGLPKPLGVSSAAPQPESLTARGPGAAKESVVTGRAILLGTLFTLAWAATAAYTDHYARVTWSFGWGSLPSGPVAFAFLLVLINGIFVRLWPRAALSRSEILVIYSLLTIAAAVIVAYVPYMLPVGAYPYYHARVEPGWESLVLPYLPNWLQPGQPELIPWFWEGLPPGASLPWRDWVMPIVAWGGPALAMLVAMLCLGSLMRKDWIENQRLTFPLTEIPMGLVGVHPYPTLGQSVFGQRVFWAGFGVSGFITLLVWLNNLYPSIPAPQLYQRVGQGLSSAGLPLSALSGMVVSITPATLGVMCLLPSEVSFSLWAFYALFMLFLVGCGALGIPPQGSQAMGGFNPRAFADYTSVGGFVIVSAMALYQSRGAFNSGLRSLLGRAPEQHDPAAPMTNRAAIIGLLFANLFLLWWALHEGMSWWSFALLMAVFYVAMIGTSRLVAAAGLTQARPAVDARWAVLRTVGASAFDPRSLLMYFYLNMGYMLEPQNFGMNYMMNSFKLIHSGRIRARRFSSAAVIAAIAALLAGSAGLLYTSYRYGAVAMECWPITAVPTCVFREFTSSLTSPQRPDGWLRIALLVGAGITFALFRLTARFVWWPLAPIGFIVASVYHTNEHIWTNALIGWALTAVIRRYGGLRLYRSLRPAFLGLVLGQFLVSVAVAIFTAVFLGTRGGPSLFA
jgi:hypothetical protein